MNILTFITTMTQALAWPVATLLLAWLFKGELAKLVPLLQKIKYGDWEAEFGLGAKAIQHAVKDFTQTDDTQFKQPCETQDRLNEILTLSPSSAVLSSWRELEQSIKIMARDHNIFKDNEGGFRDMLELLQKKGVIEDATASIIQRLRSLRNVAIHEGDSAIKKDEASRYVDACLRMERHIKNTV